MIDFSMLKWNVNNAYVHLPDHSYVAHELKTVGERIREQRIAKGLEQAPLAKAAGISVSALSQIENNITKQPKPQTLFKLADALGIEARYLVFGHNNRVAATILAMAISDTARFRLNRKT